MGARRLDAEWRGLLDGPKEALRAHFDELADDAAQAVNSPMVPIGWKEFLLLVLRRIYHSSALTLLYVLVLIANIIILVDVVQYPSEAEQLWFVVAEALITAAVVNEVALRLFLVGCDYFLNWSNIFDFVVAMCCILLVILSFHSRWLSGMGGLADVELTFLLLLYRIVVSVLRAVVMVKRHYHQRQQSTDTIDFSLADPESCDLERKASMYSDDL